MPIHSHSVIKTRDETLPRTLPRMAISFDSSQTCTPIPLPVLSNLVTQVVQAVEQVHPRVAGPQVSIPSSITAIIVNFKTKHLTKVALSTLISHYPTLPIILVDNGSGDSSTQYIAQAAGKLSTVTSLLLDTNIGHGPALHTAIQQVTTPYVFAMDSDCEVQQGGFLELMLQHFQSDSNLYATGWLRIVDKQTGVSSDEKSPGGRLMEYIHPYAMLFDRGKYLELTPFQHAGAPATGNMLSAHEAGYKLLSFPIDQYVYHLVAGTRRMYEGKWNPKVGDRPSRWDKDKKLPI